MTASDQGAEKSNYGLLFLLFAAIAGLFGIYYWLLSRQIPEVAQRGLFGDSFGAFTALASGLAFAGMIYAILLQSKELALQRQELRLTRAEMAAAREEYARAAEAQQELVKKQMLSARIQGMAAIVQGRYQMAAARGANAGQYLDPAKAAEIILADLMTEVGGGDLDLPDVR